MSIPIWAIIAGLVVSALGVGASVYGQHQANQTNVNLNQQNNELQQHLAGQANQWNLEQWARENAYNNPLAQRSRLAGANLNPSLIYGQGGLMNEAAASPQATMANTRSTQVQNPMQNLSQLDPLTMAQIENLHADSEQKKSFAAYQNEQKRGQAISNALSEINLTTWQTLDKEGLIEQAKRAGLEQDIMSSDLTSYQLFEAAWDFLIYTGYPEEQMTGKYGAGSTNSSIFNYDPERLKKAQQEFVGTQEANIATQRAAKYIADKQKEFNSNSGEIMSAINSDAAKGNVFAKIAKIAMFILEQRSGQPGISLNFSPSRSKTYDNSSHYDQSDRNTKVFNAPFK